jgi:FMN-dependent dehydrogenase
MRVDPISLYDYEARAQQVLPHDYWEFIAGGSKDELTTRRNRTAFDAISLRPRFLRDVTEHKLATTVLGTPISFPVMICPAGGHKLARPDGECATARGAGMSDTLMMLSTSSHYSMEDVAKAASWPLWFQLYHRGDEITHMLVQRAEEAGYKAVVLTVDTPLPVPKGCMACWNCCGRSWIRCWATAARPMCSTWNPAWSRSRIAGATAQCTRSHTGVAADTRAVGGPDNTALRQVQWMARRTPALSGGVCSRPFGSAETIHRTDDGLEGGDQDTLIGPHSPAHRAVRGPHLDVGRGHGA